MPLSVQAAIGAPHSGFIACLDLRCGSVQLHLGFRQLQASQQSLAPKMASLRVFLCPIRLLERYLAKEGEYSHTRDYIMLPGLRVQTCVKKRARVSRE